MDTKLQILRCFLSSWNVAEAPGFRRINRGAHRDALTVRFQPTCIPNARGATSRVLFDHHDYKEYSAAIPAADPRHSPTVDLIAQGYGPGKPKEPGTNLHVLTQHMHGSFERNSQYIARLPRCNDAFVRDRSSLKMSGQGFFKNPPGVNCRLTSHNLRVSVLVYSRPGSADLLPPEPP